MVKDCESTRQQVCGRGRVGSILEREIFDLNVLAKELALNKPGSRKASFLYAYLNLRTEILVHLTRDWSLYMNATDCIHSHSFRRIESRRSVCIQVNR